MLYIHIYIYMYTYIHTYIILYIYIYAYIPGHGVVMKNKSDQGLMGGLSWLHGPYKGLGSIYHTLSIVGHDIWPQFYGSFGPEDQETSNPKPSFGALSA